MSAGIPAVLCMAALSILIYTGWFSSVADDLAIPRSMILYYLLGAVVLSGFPPVPKDQLIQIDPGFGALLWLFVALAVKMHKKWRLSFASLCLFLGSSLFLWHEISRVETDWSDLSFRAVIVLSLVLIPVCFAKNLGDRVTLAVGGALVAHAWILIFHHEVLKPLIIGNDEYLDTVWICITSVFLVHYSVRAAQEWLRKWRKMGSI
ncbi:hypothetical protein [Lihuaxuella thermophila]|uniref:Uncharacterized protein n=1 Tax=Lihuaxuella thermophila TaxID=1173111 RepID=A0A1H8F7L6_9BACL|nr:hypothetical protein [Lihuaxuella thermophila]SEN27486.1 hypothetical protein SAMN05444955_10844 [Lihuaxuella thermophila]